MSKDMITANIHDIPIVIEELEKAQKEIQRLNNIINELEKWLQQEGFVQKQDFINSIIMPDNDKVIYVEDILDKLKELKENNK